jgi:hypothetical protein
MHCRGGWVGAHALSSDLADRFLSLAIPHPSISLENMVWGRSVQELVDRVQKPMLFMPAKVSSVCYSLGVNELFLLSNKSHDIQ